MGKFMKKAIYIFILIFFMTYMAACARKDTVNNKGNDVTSVPAPTATDTPVLPVKAYDNLYDIDTDTLPYSDEELYSQLFDINNRIDIDIDISDEELQGMQDDYDTYDRNGGKSPVYRTMNLYITIHTEEKVCTYLIRGAGIRMKGNTSRTAFYDSSSGIYNLINFKIDFGDREFATLEKLEMKWNKNDDSTYVREYYANELYRAFGIPAQHMNLCSTDFAGVHEGVFYLYEPVDNKFIKKNFAKGAQGGNLYKLAWPADFTSTAGIGIEDEGTGKFYTYDLKTNKTEADNSCLINLIKMLNSGNLTKEALSQYIDMDSFLTYAAVSYFVGNPDDLRYNYNNTYIYFAGDTGKIYFIPYDTDRCFGITKDWNPTQDAMTGVGPYTVYAEGAGRKQSNPLFIYTVDAGGLYTDEYTEKLKEIAESSWLTEEKFLEYYNAAKANYDGLTKPDYTFDNARGHNFEFDYDLDAGASSTNGNGSFAAYLKLKLASFEYYLENGTVSDTSSSDGIKPYYVLGTFGNWQVKDEYRMDYDEENNCYSFVLSSDTQVSFKINDAADEWYGFSELISVPEKGNFTAKGHDNITADAGTYKIIFYPDSKTIEVFIM